MMVILHFHPWSEPFWHRPNRLPVFTLKLKSFSHKNVQNFENILVNIVTKVLLNLVPILLSNFDQDGGDFGDDHGHNAGQKPLENPVKS